ncbi:MAG: hypothetical protein ABH823_05395, partial [bacterium]
RGVITAQRVMELIKPYHERQITCTAIRRESIAELVEFCQGTSILPRTAVTARIYFSTDTALAAKTSSAAPVCLVKDEFRPEDTVVMSEMDAIVGLTPGAIHVVTTCQGYGIPGIFGLAKKGVHFNDREQLVNAGGKILSEGDWITISSKKGIIYSGKAEYEETPKFFLWMEGETVDLTDVEQELYPILAKAYKAYKRLQKTLTEEGGASLWEISHVIQFDLKGRLAEQQKLARVWVDKNPNQYVDEVLAADLGGHLDQSRFFDLLTEEQHVAFYRQALARCVEQEISGYTAGSFMLGRFMQNTFPISFWQSFNPQEIALLINEWLLFQKYRQILSQVGERRVTRARKTILSSGLGTINPNPGELDHLTTLKLSNIDLDAVLDAIPATCEAETREVLRLLKGPYSGFYNPDRPWSWSRLVTLCEQQGVPVPQPEDI